MGWHMFAVFGVKRPFSREDLRNGPDREATIRLMRLLGRPRWRLDEKVPLFGAALDPGDDELYAGAFSNGFILCDQVVPAEFLSVPPTRFRGLFASRRAKAARRLLEAHPDHVVLAAFLQSTVNLWAYGLFRDGNPVRSAGASVITPILADRGVVTDEEARIRAGRSLEEVAETGDGEEIVFELTRHIFGGRLDSADGPLEDIELFRFTP